MDKSNVIPYTADNQITFRNAAFSIEAKGQITERIADAAVIALWGIGIAAIIKSLR